MFAVSNITSLVKMSCVLNISYVAAFSLEKNPIANGQSSGLQFFLLQLQIFLFAVISIALILSPLSLSN